MDLWAGAVAVLGAGRMAYVVKERSAVPPYDVGHIDVESCSVVVEARDLPPFG